MVIALLEIFDHFSGSARNGLTFIRHFPLVVPIATFRSRPAPALFTRIQVSYWARHLATN